MAKIEAVLFDLDGTLIDTAPDMAAALNNLLQQHEQNPLPFATIRNVVSKGSIALVRLGFGADIAIAQLESLQQQFLQLYADALCVESKLFAGMAELLDTLEQHSISWGIVTNKPGWLTKPLLEQMQLWQRASCVVSGDDLPRRKPYPDPLLHACETIGCQPAQTIYIGDDQRDIDAGLAAGTQTLIALYGYIDDHEPVQDWGADGMINSVDELHSWLNSGKFN